MNEDIVLIPANYTDAGKIFGMFPIRNMVECAALCLPILFFSIVLSPFGLSGTVILCAALIVPVGGFALGGIQDRSLLAFFRIYYLYRKNRRILIYRGSKWIKTPKEK